MLEIGVLLRQARLERGLSLEDAQRATKIRARYLEAMESGDFEALPGEVYVKGFLRSYAGFLGLPGDELVARYKDDVARRQREAERARMEAVASRKTAARRGGERGWRVTLGVCLALAVALVGLALALRGEREARTPHVARVAPASPQRSPAAIHDMWARVPPPREERMGEEQAPGVAVQRGQLEGRQERHELSVVATERCWVKVTCDGKVVFERSMLRGESATWHASTSIRIRVGNAGGIDATFDGVYLGALGRPGEVVERTFPVQ